MINKLLTLNEALASIIFKIIKVQKGICFQGYSSGLYLQNEMNTDYYQKILNT
jgi:hypothetical protein